MCWEGRNEGRSSWLTAAADQKSSVRQLLHKQDSGFLFFIPIFEIGEGLLAQGKQTPSSQTSLPAVWNSPLQTFLQEEEMLL